MAKAALEQRISRAMCSLLGSIAEEADFVEHSGIRDVLICLEYFLPQILAEVYPYWKGESLDGFYLAEARKTGFFKAELRGVCILISDQAITQFYVRMQVSPIREEIISMECRLGRRGDGKGDMERIPWSRWHGQSHMFLQDSLKPIDWTYKITFGEESGSV
jgi:hypothetical protein